MIGNEYIYQPLTQYNNISIQFPEGQLTTIMGSVGSGKSSLLHALLGDMENFNGRVNVKVRYLLF
ncbi:unnamed protein product [Schistosoma curassoni]|uniref:ABC transporter domain-containing protein n=1 Tax=Schistosoma curassoni TaxID=6186 RepID=A0A183L7J3_9TREM|nr:unnamed protein product [Schistosoma curassoni]